MNEENQWNFFKNLDDSHENWENQWNYQRKTKSKNIDENKMNWLLKIKIFDEKQCFKITIKFIGMKFIWTSVCINIFRFFFTT